MSALPIWATERDASKRCKGPGYTEKPGRTHYCRLNAEHTDAEGRVHGEHLCICGQKWGKH